MTALYFTLDPRSYWRYNEYLNITSPVCRQLISNRGCAWYFWRVSCSQAAAIYLAHTAFSSGFAAEIQPQSIISLCDCRGWEVSTCLRGTGSWNRLLQQSFICPAYTQACISLLKPSLFSLGAVNSSVSTCCSSRHQTVSVILLKILCAACCRHTAIISCIVNVLPSGVFQRSWDSHVNTFTVFFFF